MRPTAPPSQTGPSPLNVEQAVARRYSAASRVREPALCCPVQYDPRYLDVLPPELVERDYGCGDPSRYVQPGETVLDLGSGGGKICYIASQIVGPEGRVFGVDMNDDMLELARKYQPQIAAAIGWNNVEFRKGRIQDLALDLEQLDRYLAERPVANVDDYLTAQRHAKEVAAERPMIASDSIDVVLSNCVLNLVEPADRELLFGEIFRVLKRGGRAVISDIVSDEPVPPRLRADAQLWSGCLSGAHEETEFLRAFERCGFYGIELLERQQDPWAVIEGIEFRSVTVRAYKGKDGPCLDHRQAVIYQGPWKTVTDDDGHILRRGERMAVCQKTFEIYTRPPYADEVVAVPPAVAVRAEDVRSFDCHQNAVRSPRDTKSGQQPATVLPAADCCGSGGCGCD